MFPSALIPKEPVPMPPSGIPDKVTELDLYLISTAHSQ